MLNEWAESERGRLLVGAAAALGAHLVLAGLCALLVVNFAVEPPEFVELNVGRLSTQQLTRLIEQSEATAVQSSPDERSRAPERRLPEVDMPAITPSETERAMLPDQVSLEQERIASPPPRPAGTVAPELPSVGSDNKVIYEGARLDLGERPGEGIESEHVGSDIQPIFLIEGELRGREFHEAAITEVPEMPARTQVLLDVVVAPSGAVISAIVARKENAELEEFAVNFIRRCRFDPLPPSMPQENQAGRITITFIAREDR